MERRLCFVISPIGGENSPIRKQANYFLELVKEVGELHNLEVKRADEVVVTPDINDDIIDMVQHADLCVVDLTGLNPNVMYEFGMRCQTGLPYIVCAEKDTTKLPFDIISKRTIFYGNLGNTEEYKSAVREIRKHIKIFEDRDYQVSNAISLLDIYNLLQNIAEKIEKSNVGPVSSFHTSDFTNNDISMDELLSQLSPSQAFQYAYSRNQVALAEQILEMCRNEPFHIYYNKLCALASIGSEKAANEILEYLHDNIDSLSVDDITSSIGCVVSCYNRLDIEKDHIQEMENLFEYAIGRAQTNRERAAILNQKERLLAGAGEYLQAKNIAEKVLKYFDEEPAYHYNYATVLHHLGDTQNAIESALNAIRVSSKPDADHLFLVCELLKKSDQSEHRELYEIYMKKLAEISPIKARLINLQN